MKTEDAKKKMTAFGFYVSHHDTLYQAQDYKLLIGSWSNFLLPTPQRACDHSEGPD